MDLDSQVDPQAAPEAEPRIERWSRWIAASLSVLLHVAFLLVLMFAAPPPVVTSPQGASSGGRVRVNFIGEPAPAPPSPSPTPAPTPPQPERARDRLVESKPVPHAEYVLPPPAPEPVPAPEPPAKTPAQASGSPAYAQRNPRWTGRPPGLLEEDLGPRDAGTTGGAAEDPGTQRDMSGGEPSMDIGGFQIIYDLLAEERLRTWQAQGMEEISFPLPGLRQRMVCPVEIALRRGSGKCRLLEPTDPQMQEIGDARQVVVVMYVYRRGELVWRGPGPYR